MVDKVQKTGVYLKKGFSRYSMNKIITLQSMSVSKRLTFTALFAALCCVSTVVITVPLPTGYCAMRKIPRNA